MGTNDKYLLDQLLQKRVAESAPDLSDSRFFEFFVADELLKHYGLSNDELDSGLVAGGNDGGIDGIYAFVDDNLLTPDFEVTKARNSPVLRLVIMQAKQSAGFSEQAINSLILTARDLFDLSNALPSLSRKYNAQLVAVIANYRRAINDLMERFPRLEFVYYYATKGDSEQVHHNVRGRVNNLKEEIETSFSDCEYKFQFLGARDLLTLARRQASSTLTLAVQEYLSAEREGIVCLVHLRDYYRFITDEYGRRRQVIFDANVREYEGDVEVNEGIRNTLISRDNSVNFWWLNNGITIVASRAPLTGKTLTLENPNRDIK